MKRKNVIRERKTVHSGTVWSLIEGDTGRMMTNFEQAAPALTGCFFSETAIGTSDARSGNVFPGVRRLHFDAIAACEPLSLACLLLFWLLFEWHR
jgi:hypothetical protein